MLLYFVGKGGRWHRVQVQGAKQLLKVLLPMLFVLLRPPVNINHTLSKLLFKHALTDSIKSNLVLLSVLHQPPVQTDYTPSVFLFKHEQTQSNPSSAAVLSSSVHLSTLITHRVFLFLNMNKQMQIKSTQHCRLALLCPPVNTDHKSSVFLSKHELKGSMKSTMYCLLYTPIELLLFTLTAHSEHLQLHTLYICTAVYTCQHWTHPQSTCSSHITVHLQLLPTLLNTPVNTGYTHRVLAFHMQQSISSCSPPCCIICIHLSTLDTPTGHLIFIPKKSTQFICTLPHTPDNIGHPPTEHLLFTNSHPTVHLQLFSTLLYTPVNTDMHQVTALLFQQISSLKPVPCWSLSSSVHLLTLNMCPASLLLTHTHKNKVD